MYNKIIIPSEKSIYLKKRHNYSNDKLLIINIAYILGILVWTILVCIVRLYVHDVICTVLLFLPYVVFAVGISNSSKITKDTENQFFSYNYLSVGLLIFLPLLTWMGTHNKKENTKFIVLVILALIFTMLSMMDIFVSPEYLSVMKHVKSIFQTISMTLLIYAIYLYYISNY